MIVAGHICLDVIPVIEEKKDGLDTFLVPGKLIEIGPARMATGGTVPNTGLALHRLGFRTKLVGKLGRDLFGSEILHVLKQYGEELTENMIVSPQEHTSYTMVINPPGVDRIFLHCTGANDTFTSEDIRQELLNDVRLFHFGYPPLMKRMYEEDGAELERLLARVKHRGMTVSLDMAKPDPESTAGRADWRRILARAIPHVDIFLPSFEELLFMLRPEIYHQLSKEHQTEELLPYATDALLNSLSGELLDMGAAVVAIKLGQHGLYVRTTAAPDRLRAMGSCSPPSDRMDNWLDRELLAPCYQVSLAGTTGAGDATIAGFLAALLKGMKVEEALLSAVGTGAFSVEQSDAVSGIPSWQLLNDRIAAGWEQHMNQLELTGWQYKEQLKVWSK